MKQYILDLFYAFVLFDTLASVGAIDDVIAFLHIFDFGTYGNDCTYGFLLLLDVGWGHEAMRGHSGLLGIGLDKDVFATGAY